MTVDSERRMRSWRTWVKGEEVRRMKGGEGRRREELERSRGRTGITVTPPPCNQPTSDHTV
jgi:hypothetical protein